jgi:Ca2+-transporting ATPase
VRRALVAAERANNAVLQEHDGRWTIQGDPTEGALIVAARKLGLDPEALEARYGRVGEVPFSSERKLMSTVHADSEKGERLRALTKGAPDVLLKHCTHRLVGGEAVALSEADRALVMEQNEALAGEGLRTLGVAFRSLSATDPAGEPFGDNLEHDLVFLGLIGMIDPPRREARVAVARAKGAGIRVIMITGDHPKTAAAVASELGITTGRAVLGASAPG